MNTFRKKKHDYDKGYIEWASTKHRNCNKTENSIVNNFSVIKKSQDAKQTAVETKNILKRVLKDRKTFV